MAAPAYEIIDTPIVVFDMLIWQRLQKVDTNINPLDMIPICVDLLVARTTMSRGEVEQIEPDDFWEISGRMIAWLGQKAFLLSLSKAMDKMEPKQGDQ